MRVHARPGHFMLPRPKPQGPCLGTAPLLTSHLAIFLFPLSPPSHPHFLLFTLLITSCIGIYFSLVLSGKLFMVNAVTVCTGADNPCFIALPQESCENLLWWVISHFLLGLLSDFLALLSEAEPGSLYLCPGPFEVV